MELQSTKPMSASFDPYYEWLGIPPKDQPPHLYRLLGLEVFESNPAVIENAADRQMAHLRTFQSGKKSELSQRLLNELAKAKVVLLNADKKQAYDQALRKKLQATTPSPPQQPSQPSSVPQAAVQKPAMQQPAPLDLGPSATTGSASATSNASASSLRRGRRRKPSIWQHPAVIAGMVSGGVVAIIGFAIFMFGGDGGAGGGDPVAQGNGGANGIETGETNPSTNGEGENTNGDGANGNGETSPENQTDAFAGTFGVNDPVLADAFGRPDIDTLDELRLAWGMTGDKWAICQVAELEKLESLASRMAKYGFRIDQLRPYTFNGNHKFAAIWRQDGRPFRIAIGKSAEELTEIDKRLKAAGFQPVDVAGYEADDGVLFTAAWKKPQPGEPATEMTVGLDALASQGLVQKRKNAGWAPKTIHYVFPKGGTRLESEVWRKADPAEDLVIRTGAEKTYESELLANFPVSVSLAFNPSDKSQQFSAVYDKTTKAPKAWESIHEKTPREALPIMRSRMGENMEPIALDVARIWSNRRAALRSISIWNLEPGATPTSRQVAVMAKHGATGTSGSRKEANADRLLVQGLGGIEVLNTDTVAQLGGEFTAEVDVMLSAHPSKTTEHVLLGTARGEGPLNEGWQLIARESPGAAAELEFRYAGMTEPLKRSIPGDFRTFRKVAIAGSGSGTLWSVNLYIDGDPVVISPVVRNSLKPAANNLTIGVHPQGAHGMRFYGAVNQFRLSEGNRYGGTRYLPETRFTNDPETLALLDFKEGESTRMEDISGRNRAGFRRSTVWLGASASIPRHPGTVVAANTNGETTPTTPDTTQTSQAPPESNIERKPAPAEAAVANAVEQIREVYKDDYTRATTPPALVALAAVLRKQATEETDAASQYALLQEAALAAATGGNVTLALSIVDETDSRFDGDYWEDRAKLVSTAFKAARSRPEKIAVAQSAYDVAQRAANEDQFDTAVKLYDSASAEARRAGDTELAKSINIRSRQVKQIREEFKMAAAAEAKVDSGAAQPEDYLRLGKFLTYLRDDWKSGLPHLAKGSDAELAAIAAADLKNPSAAKEQVVVGDQWKAYADKLKEDTEKTPALRRAYYWFSQAAPQLSGLSRARVQRTMNEIATATGGVAVAGTGERLAFLDVKPGQVHEFKGHSRDIRALAVSTSGRYLASSGYDGSIFVWDVQTGKSLHTLASNTRLTYGGLAITPDERFVMAGTSSNNVAVWDMRNGQPAFVIPAASNVVDIDVSADGRKMVFAVSTSSQPNLGVFGLTKRKPLGILKSASYPRQVRVSSDGNKAVTVDSSNNLTLWNLVSFRPEANYSIPRGSVNDLAYSADGRVVAIASGNDEILIWNPLTQQLEATLKDSGNFSSVRSVDVTDDGKHAVVADYYKGLVVWDIAAEKVVARLGDSNRISSSHRWRIVRLLPDTRGAIVGDSQGKLFLMRLPEF